ncbi:Hypothetical predicted protein [Olea europaea subsp. europaea]|uniref:Uncharacterized protein n=1 Tax=Olea europaea subsp. europaea TaxID=158383 RepID=A0A8S0S7T9_OLEEU|nr:Hypothetical predicted protein [Olea europaea subsp. europaea]
MAKELLKMKAIHITHLPHPFSPFADRLSISGAIAGDQQHRSSISKQIYNRAQSVVSSSPAHHPFQELIAEAVVAMQIYDRCLK